MMNNQYKIKNNLILCIKIEINIKDLLYKQRILILEDNIIRNNNQ